MRKERIILQDILDAISDIKSFTAKTSAEKFIKDGQKSAAVMMKLAVIGEAAKLITPETKAKMQDIPWGKMAGMRDKLIHAYFSVDKGLVYKTATETITLVEKEIRKYLK